MSDVRAAAERLRRCYAGEETMLDVYGRTPHSLLKMHDDTEMVANAYLAEHPADDGEPITEEWLRGLGFRKWGLETDAELYDLYIPMRDELGWQCRLAYQSNGFYAVRLCDDHSYGGAESVELLDTRNRKPAVSRGQVRRLLAALGITEGGRQ